MIKFMTPSLEPLSARAHPRIVRIDIQVLGPFMAYLGGRDVTPSAAKQRQILALLALNAGQVVTASTLAEELWADCPPRRADTALQTYVLHLRDRLTISSAATARRDRTRLIRTTHSGYLLDGQSCRTDIEDFQRLALSGRLAAEEGHQRLAAELLARALALWRGPALVDVVTGPVLEIEAASLEGTRMGVLERRITADLALGRHADIAGELSLLAAKNPMNEKFCALLMTAQYRSGHIALALDAFRRLRATLTAELGVEPSPLLQRLQQAVLSGDPALERGDAGVPAGGASRWYSMG